MRYFSFYFFPVLESWVTSILENLGFDFGNDCFNCLFILVLLQSRPEKGHCGGHIVL